MCGDRREMGRGGGPSLGRIPRRLRFLRQMHNVRQWIKADWLVAHRKIQMGRILWKTWKLPEKEIFQQTGKGSWQRFTGYSGFMWYAELPALPSKPSGVGSIFRNLPAGQAICFSPSAVSGEWAESFCIS